MECSYCRHDNPARLHRCQRCGRELRPLNVSSLRPQAELNRETPTVKEPGRETWLTSSRTPGGEHPFRPQLASSGPVHLRAKSAQTEFLRPGPIVVPNQKTAAAAQLTPVRQQPSQQLSQLKRRYLPTYDSNRGPETLSVQTSGSIACDLPVASPIHRLLAAAVDFGLTLLAIGLFTATFLLAGGELPANKTATLWFAGGLLMVVLSYHLLWALLGVEPPGQDWVGLRLVTFQGARPSRRTFLIRWLATISSGAVLGFGLVWCFLDMEKLAWQDYLSGTFLTPTKA